MGPTFAKPGENNEGARKIRILHVYKTWYPDSWGGIEQVIRQLSAHTDRLGFENHLFVPSARVKTVTEDQEGPLHVTRVPVTVSAQSTPIALGGFGAFRRAARAADLLHYQFPYPFGDLLHLTASVGRPGIVTYQSDVVRQRFVRPFYTPLMHRFLGSMRRIVATSQQYADSSAVLRRYREKVEVIGLGLDPSSYPQPSADCLARWKAQVGQDFFLFVGVLRYYKGLHVLLEACAGTDLPVVIAGDGPLAGELRAQARALGLTRVHFTGAVGEEDKAALFTLCKAVVFPSHLRSEAFGVTLLEGALHGKPLISCEIGTGSSYVNADGASGLVVPPQDPPAFRAAMRALAGDDARCAALGRGARERFDTLFTAEKMALSYARLYRELLQ